MSEQVKRIFIVNGEVVEDADPQATPREVLESLVKKNKVQGHAVLEGPEADEDGNIMYTITGMVGQKG